MEGREEAAGREHEGPLGQDGAAVVDPLQVASGHVCHADGSGRAVQELVAVPAKSGKEAQFCFVFSDLCFQAETSVVQLCQTGVKVYASASHQWNGPKFCIEGMCHSVRVCVCVCLSMCVRSKIFLALRLHCALKKL